MRAGRQCRDVPAGASDVSTGRRMHLQRTDATASPQADPLHPVFYKRLCAVPAYVHFEKQRTHLVGTSLHPLAGRQPQSGIRRKRQKPRCVQDGNAGTGDVGTYRQVRPTCQPAGKCIYKERMPLHLHGPTLCIPSFINVCTLCRHTFILKNNGRTLSVRPYIPLLAGNRNQGYGGKGKKRIRPTCLYMFSTFSKLPFPYFVK